MNDHYSLRYWIFKFCPLPFITTVNVAESKANAAKCNPLMPNEARWAGEQYMMCLIISYESHVMSYIINLPFHRIVIRGIGINILSVWYFVKGNVVRNMIRTVTCKYLRKIFVWQCLGPIGYKAHLQDI